MKTGQSLTGNQIQSDQELPHQQELVLSNKRQTPIEMSNIFQQ